MTRNADLFVDDEETEDLLRAVQGELASRRYGDAVRLETFVDCPAHVRDFLLERFELSPEDHYAVDGPVNLNRLHVDLRPGRSAGAQVPALRASGAATSARLTPDLFEAIREQDVLLHHPFHSFAPVVEFLGRPLRDPQVLAIKQTLYRAGPDSPVVDALVAAARAGKEVTVVIELMARFDEAANIDLANRLQEAGAHVMYGVVGYKTHAKLIMVVRREQDRLRRYCHLGTGNYHPRDRAVSTPTTACSPATRRSARTCTSSSCSSRARRAWRRCRRSCSRPSRCTRRCSSRRGARSTHARAGRPARIVAKMNALDRAADHPGAVSTRRWPA